MLRQNRELKPHRIWNWTLPAWRVTLTDGSAFNACPSAGPCVHVCYARQGTYRFPAVLRSHTANLERVLIDRDRWQSDMEQELTHRRFRPTGVERYIPEADQTLSEDAWLRDWADAGGAAVRIHDSGDFFDRNYLLRWFEVARATDDVLFYAYTKEVPMVRAAPAPPHNLRLVFSTGGQHDHLLDPNDDRHADVFPSTQAIIDAGYTSQDAVDLLAVLLPTTRIGIPANRIPAFNKRMAGRRFSELVPPSHRLRVIQED